MAHYYVNKSGDDGNDGLSPATAFLTITKAWNMITPSHIGDITVQSGIYKGEGDLTGWAKVNFIADGLVIIDGENLLSSFWSDNNFSTPSRVKGFIFKNFINHIAYLPNATLIWEDNIFDNAGYYGAARGVNGSNKFFRNIFMNMYRGIQVYNGWNVVAENNTAYNITEAFYRGDTNTSGSLKNNIMINCGYAISKISGFAITSDYNCIYNCTKVGQIDTTDYTTLADWQTQGFDLNSINSDPKFIDVSKSLFGLDNTSPCISGGEKGYIQGAIKHCPIKSLDTNLPTWHPDVNILWDSTHKWWYLASGTEGKIASPVFDFGSKRRIGRIFSRGLETYPHAVRDYDKSDSAPNRRNVEYRYADASFNWNDPTPIWQTAERMNVLDIYARYFQIRETLRIDGVAA